MSSVIDTVAISPTGVRILRVLVGRPAKTTQELADALNVTRTAITSQLDELVHAGFVEQQLEYGDGRGRPKYRFSATLKAISRVFDGLQKFLVPATWKSIKKHLDEETFQTICEDVAADVAAPFLPYITATEPAERLKQLEEAHKRVGRLVEMKQEDGNVYYWKYTCPYALMVDDDRSICDIDRMGMEIGAGAPMIQIQHRLDGDPCCIFHLQDHAPDIELAN
jgi:predicted ArsR family transcriptional regulator